MLRLLNVAAMDKMNNKHFQVILPGFGSIRWLILNREPLHNGPAILWADVFIELACPSSSVAILSRRVADRVDRFSVLKDDRAIELRLRNSIASFGSHDGHLYQPGERGSAQTWLARKRTDRDSCFLTMVSHLTCPMGFHARSLPEARSGSILRAHRIFTT